MDIDKFGEIIDNFLKESAVGMFLNFKEGTLVPEIEDNHGLGPVMNLYMLMHAIKVVIKELVEIEGPLQIDKDRLPDMLDNLMEIIKSEILSDYKEEGKE